jgi:hypothetical protein
VPEWAISLLSFGVGVLLTGIIGFLTIRFQLQEEGKRRAEDALRDRRERGAAAVGPVRLLLGEANPDHWMVLAESGMDEDFQEIFIRWRGLREPLAVYAAGHPSSDVGTLATQLQDAVVKSYGSTAWAMASAGRDPQQPDLTPLREKAQRDYAEAVRLADDLLKLVREEPVDRVVHLGGGRS